MDPTWNILAAWIGILLGMLSGVALGAGFGRDDFAGGYASWRRRLFRLAHVCLFAIPFLNLALAFTAREIGVGAWSAIAGGLLIFALPAMPGACLLAAADRRRCWVFAAPVLAMLVAAGVTVRLHQVRPWRCVMRLGFLAMSGVRVCDAELLEIGLTLPGFVERSEVIASLPSLGLLTLAGATPAHHDLRYVEAQDAGADLSPLLDRDIVAISFLTAQAPAAYALADRLRAHSITVVMGGLHATALPDEAGAHADAVVVGEGEPQWPRLLEDAERGRLLPRYRNTGDTFDLASAPMPAFHLLDIARYNRLTVQTSRGCPWKCEFCASSITLTSRYKQKPAERVLAEIDRIRELWPRPFIEFADDNSFVNKAYWKALLPRLAERRIRWFTETDISVADDPELLDLMREAGCAEVLIGIESPTPDATRGIELRTDWKRRRAPTALDGVRRIQSHGIRVNGCFVVGLDGHAGDVFDAVYDFADRAALFDVQITLPTPFPGTPFYDRLKRAGRLTHDAHWDRCTLFDLNFTPDPMSARELRAGFLDLMRRLYADEFQRDRRDRFQRQARRATVSRRRSA